MPTATLAPDATFTNSPAWTSTEATVHEAIDEGIASTDGDTTHIEATGGSNSVFIGFPNVPADYLDMTGGILKVQINMKRTGSKADFIDFKELQLFELDESTAITSATAQSATGSYATFTLTLTITGDDSAAAMNTARLRLLCDAGADDAVRVSTVDLILEDYNPIPSGSLIYMPPKRWLKTLQISWLGQRGLISTYPRPTERDYELQPVFVAQGVKIWECRTT